MVSRSPRQIGVRWRRSVLSELWGFPFVWSFAYSRRAAVHHLAAEAVCSPSCAGGFSCWLSSFIAFSKATGTPRLMHLCDYAAHLAGWLAATSVARGVVRYGREGLLSASSSARPRTVPYENDISLCTFPFYPIY